MLSPGSTLGRYVVEDLLGTGGMGSVYRARLVGPQGFDKEVALKVLLESESDHWRASLAQEARLSARLRHRNIVDVYEFAEVNGMVMIAMELVDGLSLTKALKVGGIPPLTLALEIAMQACAGLGAAHGASEGGQSAAIIHRDIKPGNIMLAVDGTVKVVDFGIATRVSAGGGEVEQDIQGTLTYMSPEQVQTSSIDGRSDLFSLGAVLFAMVSGESLFSGHYNALTLGSKVGPFIQQRIDASGLRTQAPSLVPILERTLSVSPGDRYTAEELEDDLDDLLASLPRGPRLRRWVRDLVRTGAQTTDSFLLDTPTQNLSEMTEYIPDAAEEETTSSLPFSGLPVQTQERLPGQSSNFIGNQTLVTALLAELQAYGGCWALCGPQGVGKSRTALELLALLRRSGWTDLIWVNAEHSESLNDMAQRVGTELGVDLSKTSDLEQRSEAIMRALIHRDRVVLVVDDISRIAPEAIDLVHEWASVNAEVRIIVTCVQRTENHRSIQRDITPLSESDAVHLLMARTDQTTNTDPMILRRIVNAVDCLPLGIELAAAQVSSAGAQHVADELVVSSHRTRDALQEMLNWSWSVLEPWQKDALVQCSVFQAPFTLMAAETVIQLPPDSPWVHDVLNQLQQASWLSVTETPQGTKYRVFASVRTFLGQQTQATKNIDALRLRHALWMAERIDYDNLRRISEITNQSVSQQIRSLNADLWAALIYVTRRNEGALAAQLIEPASQVLLEFGMVTVAKQAMTDVLQIPRLDPEDRAQVIGLLGDVKMAEGDREEGFKLIEEAVEILESSHPERGLTRKLRLAYALGTTGRFGEAEVVGRQVLEAIETEGLPQLKAAVHGFMARLFQFTHQPEASLRHAREGKRAWKPSSTVAQTVIDYSLGEAECNSLNFVAGYRCLRGALNQAIRFGDTTTTYALSLAMPMVQLGHTAELLELLEWALLRARRAGHVLNQVYAGTYLAAARVTRLGGAASSAELFDEASANAEMLGIAYLKDLVITLRSSTVLSEALRTGQTDVARSTLEAMPPIPEGAYSVRREVQLSHFAHLHLLLGETDKAMEYLTAARKRIATDARFTTAIDLRLLEGWVHAQRGEHTLGRAAFKQAKTSLGYIPGNLYYTDSLFDHVEHVLQQS